MTNLPIQQVLPELRDILNNRRNAVLTAEPGAGKTTGVPPALMDEPWMQGKTILMLEPRRLAARSAVVFMAEQKGEAVGQTVGYRMRQDTRVSRTTRITVVTEGVLTRMLQQDPGLGDVGLLIFDEFHERNLHADLGLALALEAQSILRDDLRILIMSATLDTGRVSELLGGAPVVNCPGRVYPVETIYAPPAQGTRIELAAAAAVRRALSEQPGDILVFLPGEGEIRAVQRELGRPPLPAGTRVRPLYGQLPQAEQDAAVAPAAEGERKIVLATTIAETSLTLPGIRTVIDSGLRRTQVFSPRTGMPRLETAAISRASADQRRGRAGRTAPGVCYRLWSREQHDRLPADSVPEIREADLAPLALELAVWGARDPAALPWLDAPPAAAYAQALALLGSLGALDAGGAITAHGRRLAALGAHPRAAHMLLCAAEQGDAPLACRLAALLQERDPLRGPAGQDADLTLRVEALLRFERSGGSEPEQADLQALRRIQREARVLMKQLDVPLDAPVQPAHCGRVLAYAYPDRIGQLRGGGAYTLSGGRGAELPAGQPLARSRYLVAASIDDRGTSGRVMLAAQITEAQLLESQAERIEERAQVYWDKVSGSVKARTRQMLGSLTLKEQTHDRPSPEEAAAVLLDAVAEERMSSLNWDKAAVQLRERMQFMHRLYPDWPDVSDESLCGSLREWLLPFASGMRSLRELARVPLSKALESVLTWEQRRRMDEEAPTHIKVPSGSRIAVDYSDPAAPVLAVKLQELFGQRTTPKLGGGRVPVVLHLLSPARRPVQVTSDLENFREHTYFEVKKDLKGRYPKHYWPDNPYEAVATARVRPRD